MSKTEIYCPKCKWKPRSSSRWWCTTRIGGCGHTWNTFDTRGVCPKCNWNWIITACLSCKQFSPHEEWYHDPDDKADEIHEEKTVLEDA